MLDLDYKKENFLTLYMINILTVNNIKISLIPEHVIDLKVIDVIKNS